MPEIVYDQYRSGEGVAQLSVGRVEGALRDLGEEVWKMGVPDGIYLTPTGAVVVSGGSFQMMTVRGVRDKNGRRINVEAMLDLYKKAVGR